MGRGRLAAPPWRPGLHSGTRWLDEGRPDTRERLAMTGTENDARLPGGIPIYVTERAADPCILVIFGASGDLTKRLLMPALFNLACDRLLPGR